MQGLCHVGGSKCAMDIEFIFLLSSPCLSLNHRLITGLIVGQAAKASQSFTAYVQGAACSHKPSRLDSCSSGCLPISPHFCLCTIYLNCIPRSLRVGLIPKIFVGLCGCHLISNLRVFSTQFEVACPGEA